MYVCVCVHGYEASFDPSADSLFSIRLCWNPTIILISKRIECIMFVGGLFNFAIGNLKRMISNQFCKRWKLVNLMCFFWNVKVSDFFSTKLILVSVSFVDCYIEQINNQSVIRVSMDPNWKMTTTTTKKKISKAPLPNRLKAIQWNTGIKKKERKKKKNVKLRDAIAHTHIHTWYRTNKCIMWPVIEHHCDVKWN